MRQEPCRADRGGQVFHRVDRGDAGRATVRAFCDHVLELADQRMLVGKAFRAEALDPATELGGAGGRVRRFECLGHFHGCPEAFARFAFEGAQRDRRQRAKR